MGYKPTYDLDLLRRHRCDLGIHCQGCGHRRVITVDQFIAATGVTAGRWAKLAWCFRCGICGRRKPELYPSHRDGRPTEPAEMASIGHFASRKLLS